MTTNRTLDPSVPPYNERLFGRPGLRRYYHLARFRWAERVVRERVGRGLKVVELGCYDGRFFKHIEPFVSEYVGLDANWEDGLELARASIGATPGVTLIEATDPTPLRPYADGHFDLAVSLETLEHIPPDLVDDYLDELARVTRGHFLASFPNEIGPVFAAKYVLKRLRYGGADDYTLREAVAATLGQTDKVARCEHKGFDYRRMIDLIARRFDIVEIEGLASFGLPVPLSLTVAVHAKSRRA